MSRNGTGTYTLPAGNPVVTGTTIESTWANTTLSDIATTLTDSLSRSGQGGMTAALRIADGTQAAPGVGFANETGTGIYRAGTGDARFVVSGSLLQKWTSTGSAITGVLSASGDVGVGTTSPVFGSGSGLEIERAGIPTLRLENSTASNSFELYVDSAANGVNLRGRDSSPINFWTSNTSRMKLDASGNLGIGKDPTSALDVNGTIKATALDSSLVSQVLQAAYPVGSIYINATNATNPGTLLGFGTWTAFGAGRVPVGFDSGNALFDTAEETGGSADAITVSHTHSFSATTGTQSANHTHSGTTSDPGNFITGSVTNSNSGYTGVFGSATGAFSVSNAKTYDVGGGNTATNYSTASLTAGSHTHTMTTGTESATHTHAVSGTTGSTGSSGTNANYQPYITVYMWKRTA